LSQRRHVVPAAIFAALASGNGGSLAAALLIAGQRSKRMLLHRAVLDHSADAALEPRQELIRGYGLLTDLQRRSPAAAEAIERVTAYPAVTAWAAATLRALVRRDAPLPDPGYLSAVAASAAVRAGVDIEIPVPVYRGLVVLPSLGVVRVSPTDHGGTATVRCGRGGSWIDGSAVPIPANPMQSLPTWTPLRRMGASVKGLELTVVIDDADPFNIPVHGDLRQLTTMEAARWHAALQSAWSLLTRHHRDSAAEVSAMLSVLVPLPTMGDRQVSKTSRDAFGAVALSEPLDGTSLAETLIHEVQHLKLGALLDLVPLLDDQGEARWYAPWRDDPRPLSGLLQGAYAHLGIVRFWRTQRWLEPRSMYGHVQFARWREQTWEVVRTLLASGRLTAQGRIFVDRMRTTLQTWLREPVPGEAVERACASAARHRRSWRQMHRKGAETA
jgi:HEXXH motif-containing protein